MDFFKKSYIFMIVGLSLFLFGCQVEQAKQSKDNQSNTLIENESATLLSNTENDANTNEIIIEAAVENDQNQIESTKETLDTNDFTLTVGDGETLGELNIKLIKVYEIDTMHYPPSKDKFIGVEVEIENLSEKALNISTLNNLSLYVNGTKQDLAFMDTDDKLNVTIQPGENIIGQVAFDSNNAEIYRFSFIDPHTSQEILWSFTEKNLNEINAE